MRCLFHARLACRRLTARISSTRRGATGIITAVGLSVLLGFGGLAVDVGAWLNATRNVQSAADDAAYSAAAAAGPAVCSGGAPSKQATAIAVLRDSLPACAVRPP